MLKEYLLSLANAFRSKLGTTDKISAQSFSDKVNEVYDKGKYDEWSEFWDDLQENGKRSGYDYAFYGGGWTDQNFKPKYDICTNGNIVRGFYSCKITDLAGILESQGLKFDVSKSANVEALFAGSSITHIPEIKTSSSCKGYSATFSGCGELVKIDKLYFHESMTVGVSFNNCNKLTDITIDGIISVSFDAQHSPLNTKSIVSIVEHLSDNATDKTVTFKKTAVNNAFGINVDDETTYTQEWKNLRNSKANWTFAYA